MVLLCLWGAGVCLVGLWPVGPTRSFTLASFLCVACSAGDTADIIRNWLLFVPGGVLLGLTGRSGRAVLSALTLSVLVEILQLRLPSRDPSLQDLLANTLGAWAGILLARRGLDRYVGVVLLIVGTLAWLVPLPLLRPTLAGTALLVEWTPVDQTEGRYDGQVLRASVGALSLEPGLADAPTLLDEAVARREPMRVSMRVGSRRNVGLTVLRVTDIHAHDIVELSVVGDDLLFKGKSLAVDLLLEQPAVRWSGALSTVATGDTVQILLHRDRGSICADLLGERSACGLAPSLSAGWAFLAQMDDAGEWMRGLLNLSWTIAIGLLFGLGTQTRRAAVAFAGTVGVVGLIGSLTIARVAPDAVSLFWLVAGSWIGGHLRQLGTTMEDRNAPRCGGSL